MLTQGIESINTQTNTKFILRLNKEATELFDEIRLTLPDIVGTNFDSKKTYKEYEHYKATMKVDMISKRLTKISEILKDRFGLNVNIENSKRNLNSITYLVTPPMNYKVINMAMDNLDSLFPKKRANNIIWETLATKAEQNSYNTLNNLKTAISEGKFKLDFKRAYVTGLESSIFTIRTDVLAATVVNLNPDEFISLLLKEIGYLFSYLEYMYTSTRNTLSLLDNFITEKFSKNKNPIESLSIALKKSGTDTESDTAIGVLEELDVFILKTYRIDKNKNSVKLDLQQESDKFVVKLGLADTLSSALVKISTLGTIRPNDTNYKEIDNPILTFLYTVVGLIVFAISVAIFSIFGILILLLVAGVKIVSFFFSYLAKMVLTIFNRIFNNDIDQNITYRDIGKRLKKIKLQLIKELRSDDLENEDKKYIMEQIDNVNKSISLIDERFSILGRYGDSTLSLNSTHYEEVINDRLENLEDNELYLLTEKFKNIRN